MAKSKKRKPQQQKPKATPVEASAEASVSENEVAKEQSVSVATTSVATPAKKTEKPKGAKAKAAPTLTKKRSRLMFFVDAFNELRKAHWPSRKETARLSVLVFTVCVVVGAILGGLDFLFTKLMGLVLFGG
jgi:preprotein translocase SecE subunit